MNKSFLQRNSYLKYVLYIIPSLIVWFTLSVLPNLQMFPMAFYKWNGISKVKTYVGWQNFQNTFDNPTFRTGLLNTLYYVLFLFLIQTAISVLLAMILREDTSYNRFFRTFFFLPLVFSSVMVALTWTYMYDPNLGILNQILTSLGLTGFNGFDWLGEPTRAILCIVFVHIWANIGYPITLITAGLQTIPETLYEAATVEGANTFQINFKITFPLLLPTLLRITLLTLSTGAFAFDYVLMMGSSLVNNSFDTFAVSMYKDLKGLNLGMPATKGVILGIILMVIFIVQFFVTKKVEESIS